MGNRRTNISVDLLKRYCLAIVQPVAIFYINNISVLHSYQHQRQSLPLVVIGIGIVIVMNVSKYCLRLEYNAFIHFHIHSYIWLYLYDELSYSNEGGLRVVKITNASSYRSEKLNGNSGIPYTVHWKTPFNRNSTYEPIMIFILVYRNSVQKT